MEQLTRFETARLIGARALQLALGAPALMKVSPADTVRTVAENEMQKKVLPLTVVRLYPNGRLERINA